MLFTFYNVRWQRYEKSYELLRRLIEIIGLGCGGCDDKQKGAMLPFSLVKIGFTYQFEFCLAQSQRVVTVYFGDHI